MANPRSGTVVDERYRLDRKIGSGGMADVWLAEDTELDRQVAIKILHDRFAQDKEFVQRFQREAQSAAGLQHPNVVGIFDRGAFGDTYFIAMEYVDGPSLKDLVKGGMGTKDAIDFTRQILTAARFAHRKGIVHRDLKPQNVLIDDEGRARVADFGIARAGENSDITATGSVMGTAQYISPEQAQGKPTTPRSDIYSIGVILYEALTGRVPFEGDSAVAVALKQVSEAPRRPSAINPNVPPALDAVVMRALAKDPDARFKDADAFLRALDAAERAPDKPRPAGHGRVCRRLSGGRDRRPGDQERRLRGVGARSGAGAGGAGSSSPCSPRRGGPGGLRADPALARGDPGRDRTGRRRGEPDPRRQGVRGGDQGRSQRGAAEPGRRAGPDPDRPRRRQGGGGLDRDAQRELGPGDRRRPDGRRADRADATKRLRKRRFQGDHDGSSSRTRCRRGMVIGTEPAAGTQLSTGQGVTLLISRGANTVAVPNVVGLDEQAALAALQNAGLSGVEVQRDSTEPEGKVLSQSPGAGQAVGRGLAGDDLRLDRARSRCPTSSGRTARRPSTALKKAGFAVAVDRADHRSTPPRSAG